MMGYNVWSHMLRYGSFLSFEYLVWDLHFCLPERCMDLFALSKLVYYHYIITVHSPCRDNHSPLSNMFQCFKFQCLFANLSLLCDNYWRTYNYLHLTNDLLMTATRQIKNRQTATDFPSNRPTDIWLTKEASKLTRHVSSSLRSRLHHGLTDRRSITSRLHRPIRTTTRDLQHLLTIHNSLDHVWW